MVALSQGKEGETGKTEVSFVILNHSLRSRAGWVKNLGPERN
jgi:hypothetical protein